MSRGQLQLLKQIIGAGDGSASLPLPQLRDNLEKFLGRFPKVERLRVESVDAGGVPCDWLDPLEEPTDRTVLYLHGGGFVVGSARSHRQLAARLCREAKARGLMVDYRLAPEFPFPAALDDAQSAYRWLLDQGVSTDRLVIAGDSAGGGLAVQLAIRLHRLGVEMPSALVLFSPWVDYAGTSPSIDQHAKLDPVVQRPGLEKMAKLYLHGTDPWDPEVTPLTADLTGLPPLLIQAGLSEALLDDSKNLAKRARDAGVDVELDLWPDMIHVWQLFAGRLDEGRQAIESAARFLSSRTE